MLSLRKFEPRDDASLISWLRTPEELYLFTGPRLEWPLDTAQLDGLRADESFTQFTAELDGTAVGHIELVSTGEWQARVARVLVAPELQGRGLGEQLVRAVLAEARARHPLAHAVRAAGQCPRHRALREARVRAPRAERAVARRPADGATGSLAPWLS